LQPNDQQSEHHVNNSAPASTANVKRSDQVSNEVYARQGMGQRIGFGKRPAILLIDMQNDFCDKDAPTTLYPSIISTYEPIKMLSKAARKNRAPVIYTQGLVAADGSSAGLWRLKTKHHGLGGVQIEDLLICGTSMSGCVRATAVDGFMRDIRCMIVREGVADRSEAVMEASLFDIDQKYGDVVTLDMCLNYLEGLPQAAAL
jgi:nicotinamidase-related amidase